MWKCLCGSVQRSVANACPGCGRTHGDIKPFADLLGRVELALSLMTGSATEITAAENLALKCLADNLSLVEIAHQLENRGDPMAMSLARALRNLAVWRKDLTTYEQIREKWS